MSTTNCWWCILFLRLWRLDSLIKLIIITRSIYLDWPPLVVWWYNLLPFVRLFVYARKLNRSVCFVMSERELTTHTCLRWRIKNHLCLFIFPTYFLLFVFLHHYWPTAKRGGVRDDENIKKWRTDHISFFIISKLIVCLWLTGTDACVRCCTFYLL